MTSAQVVETSVNVIANRPSQDYTHPDDRILVNYDMTPGFKPFTNRYSVEICAAGFEHCAFFSFTTLTRTIVLYLVMNIDYKLGAISNIILSGIGARRRLQYKYPT